MGAVSVGAPELLVLLLALVFWVVPIAAAIWALLTLSRLRTGQLEMQRRLETIERLLQRP